MSQLYIIDLLFIYHVISKYDSTIYYLENTVEAINGIKYGATVATHLYNVIRNFSSHRELGIILPEGFVRCLQNKPA